MAESGLKIHARIQKIDPEKSLETVNHETRQEKTYSLLFIIFTKSSWTSNSTDIFFPAILFSFQGEHYDFKRMLLSKHFY